MFSPPKTTRTRTSSANTSEEARRESAALLDQLCGAADLRGSLIVRPWRSIDVTGVVGVGRVICLRVVVADHQALFVSLRMTSVFVVMRLILSRFKGFF